MKEERTLEQLAAAFQAGDAAALEELVARCKDIVKKVSRKYFLIGADMEDVYQEGYLGLIKAAQNYEEDKGSFYNYACICVKSSILSAVRK